MHYLIAGGTGTLGKEFIKQISAAEPNTEITVISRDELKQKKLKSEFGNIKTLICDIRDGQAVDDIFSCEKFSHVCHFAAMKHVDICENQPMEAVKTNIIGTKNLARASIRNGVSKFIFSSTDKAVDPINVYGMTKAIAEQDLKKTASAMIFRWGNILGSRGSVIPKFIDSIAKENKIYLTHSDMTRFWIKIEDAVSFMIDNIDNPSNAREFIPPMKSAPVLQVAMAIAEIMKKNDVTVEIIGVGSGEKMHEKMGDTFSNTCETYTKDQLIEMLTPIVIGADRV